MTTLNDVAKRAGVGVSTASYVINKTGLHKVGAQTQARILAAAAELDYHPNIAGRALAKGQTFMAGAIFPTVMGSFTPEILQGLEDVLNKASYSLILCTYNSAEEFREKCRMLAGKQIDGLIVLPVTQDFEMKTCLELNEHMPLVFLTKPSGSGEIPHVRVDGNMINFLAVRYLLERGHRRIAIQCGGDLQRTEGAERAIKTVPGARLMLMKESTASGMHLLKWGLVQHETPTAYLTYGDSAAAELIAAAYELGLKVPDDFSVIGVNGEPLGKYTCPKLTSIKQPRYEQGFEAGKLLLARIDGGKTKDVILQPCLMERKSVKTI